MTGPLNEQIKKAVQCIEDGDVSQEADHYFKVKEYDVTFRLDTTKEQADKWCEDKPIGPYNKTWSCTCRHYSLFGAKSGVPCYHILAVIIWLGIKEGAKSGRKKEVGNRHKEADKRDIRQSNT